MMHHKTKITYRPEIDGLRAISVISVILLHSDFSFFNHQLFLGGFLGVDIFFVISGYLITAILFHECSSQHFHFFDFLERRIRRILPLLLTVIIVSLPLSWFYLFSDQMQDYGASLMSSVLFYSNWYFSQKDGYWDISNKFRPLLHSWSLAIEVQFYITWPLLLAFLYRYQKKYITASIILLTLSSLCYAHYISAHDANSAFYLLPTRLWEFLCGALLALPAVEKRRDFTNNITHHLPLLGLILIIISIFYFNAHTHHPSLLTAIPVIGVMLVIHFSHANSLATQCLQHKLLVKIGLLSYGLYIWHFPIFVFNRTIFIDYTSNYHKIGCIALCFVLAYITYYIIEKPCRNRKIISRKLFISASSIITIFILHYAIAAQKTGFSHRIAHYLVDLLPPYKEVEYNYIYHTKSNKSLIVTGDSHMDVLSPYLKTYAKDHHFTFAKSTIHGCIFIPHLSYIDPGNSCKKKVNIERFNFIDSAKPDYVIWGARLPHVITGNDFMQKQTIDVIAQQKRYDEITKKFQKIVTILLQRNMTVILVYPVPESHYNIPKTMLKKIRNHGVNSLSTDPITISYDEFKARTASSYRILDSIQHRNIIRIYPEKLFCNRYIQDQCVFYHKDQVFYADNNHTSTIGSQMIAQKIFNAIMQRESQTIQP